MSTQFTEYPVVPISRKFSWSGIFSGTFLFLAIEATFGMLGVAIFSSLNPSSVNAIGHGTSVGAGIWMVVLSIIALYFAGKLASTHSATATRNSGMYAGLVTFGMCIFTAYLMLTMSSGLGSTVTTPAAVTHESVFPIIADFIIGGGYWLFATLVLGMIAAASGGIHGSMTVRPRTLERTGDTKRVA